MEQRRIGQNIKVMMRERGMTQMELAKAAGVTQATVSHCVNGKRDPRVVTLAKIRKALGCDWYDLIDGVCE